MNREVSPDLHAGLRGVIRTHEGRKGRNLLFTFGFEGRNGTHERLNGKGEGVVSYLPSSLRVWEV